jgi:hypothetical protein
MFKAKSSHWLAMIPILLTLMVGGMQIFLAFTQNLSAWQVGGFGMFARPDMKYIRAYVDDVSLDPAKDYYRLTKKIDTFPTQQNLRQLAQSIACDQGKVTRVDLWRGKFDAKTQGIDFYLDLSEAAHCE